MSKTIVHTYEFDMKIIGTGSYSDIYLCKHNISGIKYYGRVISKKKIKNE